MECFAIFARTFNDKHLCRTQDKRGIDLAKEEDTYEKEKFLATKNEMLDQVAILLGGRIAEEIVFGDISTGTQNDLERSSEL